MENRRKAHRSDITTDDLLAALRTLREDVVVEQRVFYRLSQATRGETGSSQLHGISMELDVLAKLLATSISMLQELP
jgi:hypothetical protein